MIEFLYFFLGAAVMYLVIRKFQSIVVPNMVNLMMIYKYHCRATTSYIPTVLIMPEHIKFFHESMAEIYRQQIMRTYVVDPAKIK
jgi:hypothetical protein